MSVSVELNVEFKVHQGHGACRMSGPELFRAREKMGRPTRYPGKFFLECMQPLRSVPTHGANKPSRPARMRTRDRPTC